MLAHAPEYYLTQDETAALNWLKDNTAADAVILAGPEMGLFIPAQTGRRVIYGHPFETVNAELEEENVLAVYTGQRIGADLDRFLADLETFGGGVPVILPAWEALPDELRMSDPVLGARMRLAREMESDTPPRHIVTTIQALLQPVPSRARREAATRVLRVGTELDLDDLLSWLLERGFERVPAIELPGEVSIHGGIVDLYAPDGGDPIRIELFGDEIDSLRTFDVETQQTRQRLNQVAMTVATPNQGDNEEQRDDDAHILDSLASSGVIVLSELEDLYSEAKLYLQRLDDRRGLFSLENSFERCYRHSTVQLAAMGVQGVETVCRLRIESIERLTGPKQEALQELERLIGRDETVLIACHNEGARDRLGELLREHPGDLGSRVELEIGQITRGFRLVTAKTVVLSDNELFGRADASRTTGTKRKRVEARAIDTFLDLKEGDLIVHLSHGIGRYLGMQILEKEGQQEEHLHLEFKEGVRLYVPVSLIHLVQKYIGGAKAAPELSKVGGQAWAKKKQKVAEAVSDMAADMLRLQAARASRPGLSCPPDSHWMEEFDAAFPYQETDDQLRAIGDLKGDMEASRPMDRLICGDVGYGKTEVAMRAAFKAVDAGRQVAVLVPTTVLAEQHYRSFSERMAEFPVSIGSLTRFRSKAEQRETLANMAAGSLDICIGTHRIVQKDVKFKDLGLLIIDEEQRFGVEAKEMLKQIRLEVDVLTLSATPIPRTLHLSLLGVRDISNLETPPHNRIAVETRVVRFDKELIRHAIVRELNRGGQVYFVHNRVYNIESVADTLRSLVPDVTVDVVHGQMGEESLEQAMMGFVQGRVQILVATTIIESGLDIPNANTIFIHQADQYGLADLHQLRGRVGRSHHRAYCYLVLEEGKGLTPQASKRLKAIEEYSELGAGFKIAMRDLEIRGAGNILGTEQSGHIAAVGYELYCQLLENAVRILKREPLREHRHVAVDLPISAFLPSDYVPPGRLKIEMYRKISTAGNFEELDQIQAELRDRFGPVPQPARRLLEIRELQLLARGWQVDGIRLHDGYAFLSYRNPRKIRSLTQVSTATVRIVDDREACVVLPYGMAGDAPELLPLLKAVLQPK